MGALPVLQSPGGTSTDVVANTLNQLEFDITDPVNPTLGLRAPIANGGGYAKAVFNSTGQAVQSVAVTAPATNSGTSTAPNIGVSAATRTAAGSLAAADKVTIDTLQGKDSTGGNKRVFRPGDYAAGNTYDPTGTLDSTSSFTACVAAYNAFNDRAIVEVPPGVFKVATAVFLLTVAAPGMLRGADRGTSVLVPTSGTGDMITLASGVDGFSVQDIAVFQTGSPSTAGAAVNTNGADDVLITNILFNNMYQDVNVNGTTLKCSVQHSVHTQNNGSATSVGIIVTNGVAGDTYIGPDVVMSNTGATRRRASVELVQTGHAEINQCNLTGSAQGLLVDPASGQIVADLFLDASLFDSCTVNGATFNAVAGSTIKSVHSTNCWYSGTIAGTGGAGLLFTGAATGILNGFTSVGDRVLNNQTHGVQIDYGTGFQFVAPRISGNSAAGSAVSSGINIAANIGTVRICAGKSGGTDGAETGGNQKYGVTIAAGTGTDIYVGGGIDLSGNVTGPLSNLATGRVIVGEYLGGVVPPLPPLASANLTGVAATPVLCPGSAMDSPAGALQVAETWEVEIEIGATAATAHTALWGIKYGALGTAADTTCLVQGVAFSGAAVAGTGGRVTIRFQVRTLGAAGTLTGSVNLNAAPATALKAAGADHQTMTATAINTATANKFSVFCQNSTTIVFPVDRVTWTKVRG